ncbi:MMPL family transporter [Natronosalvus vescus]|uniref:MMPL family transporter n=1 Tax=Natronosalvus vescus TaxID=2953881 RepID=UPI0020902481|nr:MMPL family transporter [Natronosalvus vescus]
MSVGDRLTAAIVTHSRHVLVLCLLTTLILGAGLPALETDTSLEQFQTETPESDALAYADRHFDERDENTTTTQVIFREENALERDSLLEGLRFQQQLRHDDTIGPTLVDDHPTVGVENVVATAIIRLEEADELQERADTLEQEAAELEARIDTLEAHLEHVASIQVEYEALNASYEAGEVSEDEYERRAAELETDLEETVANATADLDDERASEFERAAASVRAIEAEIAALEREYEAGDVDDSTYTSRLERLESDRDGAIVDGSRWLFVDEIEAMAQATDDLKAEREALERLDLPPLDAQIEALEEADDDAFDRAITTVLADGGPGSERALRLLPTGAEPASLESSDRMVLVSHSLDRGSGPSGELGADVIDAQHAIDAHIADRGDDHLVFGFGLVAAEVDRAAVDTVILVGPLALVLVIGALAMAYRDVLDIVLGVAGMLAVLVWTFGIMGWTGIAFTQVFVAVPVLLVGLSIDYAIHVFMRYREARVGDGQKAQVGDDLATRVGDDSDTGVGDSMTVALAGIATAFVWVTATASIGFLATLVSPIDPIREFGLVSALGIVASLCVFGAMIPAAKVELDDALEARGIDRRIRAIGGASRVGRILASGGVAARRAPVVVLLCALLVTAGGAYGATHVDTTFDEESFLTEEPPSWTTHLGPFAPGEYRMQSTLTYLDDNFQRQDGHAQILLRGDVTDGTTLQRVSRAEERARSSEVVYVLPDGSADVRSPLTAMEAAAAESESFDATYRLADRTDDDVPDQNVLGLYDAVFDVNPGGASEVIYRSETGEYEAIRLVVGIDTGTSSAETAAEMREIAAILEGASEGGTATGESSLTDLDDQRWEATATGEPLVTYALERTLFASVVNGLLVALIAVMGVLTVAYRLTGRGAMLGVVTVIPVVIALGATLGTMAMVGIPFNVLTGMVTSLTIGLGIAYAVHVTARYTQELEAGRSVWQALDRTLSMTGGALTGSAVTTICGFGVLVVSIVPLLRQFGLVTAMTIGYAFLASVVVLPTLLALWTRFVAPAPYRHDDFAFDRSSWRGRLARVGDRDTDGDSD